jgi:hypothetical protein
MLVGHAHPSPNRSGGPFVVTGERIVVGSEDVHVLDVVIVREGIVSHFQIVVVAAGTGVIIVDIEDRVVESRLAGVLQIEDLGRFVALAFVVHPQFERAVVALDRGDFKLRFGNIVEVFGHVHHRDRAAKVRAVFQRDPAVANRLQRDAAVTQAQRNAAVAGPERDPAVVR